MKKLTSSYKQWLIRRASTEAKRRRKHSTGPKNHRSSVGETTHFVEAWFGDRTEKVICRNNPIVPPKKLCLADNTVQTIEFLDNLRKNQNLNGIQERPGKFKWIQRPRNGKGMPRIRTYMDFSSIEEVSTAVALIMTAEYQRAAQLVGSAPPAIDIHRWSDGVFVPLFQIGFFEAIGSIKESDKDLRERGPATYFKAISGTGGHDLKTVAEKLRELSEVFDADGLSRSLRVELNSAVGEAMVNVSKWAYPTEHDFTVPHVGKFWVTASADPSTKMFTVVIYDQGVSIPISYPQKRLSQRALDYLSQLKQLLIRADGFEFQDDGAYIDCAMKFGSSQTGKDHRGKGLPQMKELIDGVGEGSLTVCSRGGVWHYEHGKSAKYESFPNSVGGTLIEWRIGLSGGFSDG